MLGEEADDLATHDQLWDRQGEIDPVQTVDLQQLLAFQDIVDGYRIRPHHTRRHGHPTTMLTHAKSNSPA
jgi:hypothetical protein